MEKEGQRDLSTEQILYTLIKLREDVINDSMSRNIITINKEKCRAIGIFNYTLKGEKNKRASRLFLINETLDGEEVNVIYDENGRFIAWEHYDELAKKRKIETANDVELEQQVLERQFAREQIKTGKNAGTAKEGERDLPKEQKEDEEKEEQKEASKEKQQETKLYNLKDIINLDYSPRIPLNQTINGFYLWEILHLERKLKGKLPKRIK